MLLAVSACSFRPLCDNHADTRLVFPRSQRSSMRVSLKVPVVRAVSTFYTTGVRQRASCRITRPAKARTDKAILTTIPLWQVGFTATVTIVVFPTADTLLQDSFTPIIVWVVGSPS